MMSLANIRWKCRRLFQKGNSETVQGLNGEKMEAASVNYTDSTNIQKYSPKEGPGQLEHTAFSRYNHHQGIYIKMFIQPQYYYS